MPFLLRKWTLPEKKQNQKKSNQVTWKNPDKVLSFWSIPQNDKETDEDVENESMTTINPTEKILNLLTTNLLEEGEMDKKIEENYFTINLLDLHQTVLPKVKSISKAQKLLVTKPQFQFYKKANSIEGVYHSSLLQIERKEQSCLHKLNISSKAQIKSRKNIFELQHRNKSGSCSFSFRMDNSSVGSKKFITMANSSVPPRKISQSLLNRRPKMLTKSSDKWKLGDFLDPIIQTSEPDEEKVIKLREYERYMYKVRKIENTCQIVESNDNSNKYLQIFGRFSSAVESKLIKKQRKLQKIQAVFKYRSN